MTITFQQIKQSGPTSGTNSFTVTITPNNAGDLLILGIGVYANGSINSITSVGDNNGNTWTVAVQYQQAQANVVAGAVYYAANCNAGATLITVMTGSNAQDVGLFVHEYSGCATSYPIDTIAVSSGTAATVTSPSIVAIENEMIFSFLPLSGQTITSIGGSYQKRSNLTTDPLSASGDLLASSTGTYASAWNIASTGTWLSMLVTLSSIPRPPKIAIMQYSVNEPGDTGVNPITTTFSSPDTNGNAIIVVAVNALSTPLTWTGVTDTEGNVYTACAGASVSDSTDQMQVAMFIAFNIVGGTSNTIKATWSGSSAYLAVYAIEVYGIKGYDAGSGNATFGSHSATASSGAFMLNYGQDFVIAVSSQTGQATDPGAGYTALTITAGNFTIIEYIIGTSGSQNATATLNTSQAWALVAGGFHVGQISPPDNVLFGIT